MSELSNYTSQIQMLSAHLKTAKTDKVRAVLMSQISDLQRRVAVIKSQPSKEYFAQLEARYAVAKEESVQETEEPAKRGRKKKEVAND